jgi:hypothetical protein
MKKYKPRPRADANLEEEVRAAKPDTLRLKNAERHPATRKYLRVAGPPSGGAWQAQCRTRI